MNPVLHDVPEELTTPRLNLRAPRPGEGRIVTRSVLESLPELKLWLPWASDAYSETTGEEWCRKCAAEFIARVQLAYCIYLHDGRHVGNVSAFKIDWNLPGCEIGYWLHSHHYGQGLMTEAVDAFCTMLRGRLGMNRIEIRCDDRNTRSAAVATRCGFALDGVLRQVRRMPDGHFQNERVYSWINESRTTP